jgi:hypothetical protein
MQPPPPRAAAAPAARQTDHQMQADKAPPFILIGSDHSLYTGKLRAYLIWRGLPFIELTASAELYKQVILPRTGGQMNAMHPPPLPRPPPPSTLHPPHTHPHSRSPPPPHHHHHHQHQLSRSTPQPPPPHPPPFAELCRQVILPRTGGHPSSPSTTLVRLRCVHAFIPVLVLPEHQHTHIHTHVHVYFKYPPCHHTPPRHPFAVQVSLSSLSSCFKTPHPHHSPSRHPRHSCPAAFTRRCCIHPCPCHSPFWTPPPSFPGPHPSPPSPKPLPPYTTTPMRCAEFRCRFHPCPYDYRPPPSHTHGWVQLR